MIFNNNYKIIIKMKQSKFATGLVRNISKQGFVQPRSSTFEGIFNLGTFSKTYVAIKVAVPCVPISEPPKCKSHSFNWLSDKADG